MIVVDSSEEEYVRVRPAWLERRKEDILDPDLPIVDAHHHIWDAPNWRYMFEDFLQDIRSGHNIRSTVFVQCYSMYRKFGPRELRSLGETEFANGVAAMAASGVYGETRVCDGIVGMVDLTLGAGSQGVLEKHVAAAGGRFKGVRQIAAWHEEEEVQRRSRRKGKALLMEPPFREGFAMLAPVGLSFDAWLFHTQLDELMDLARAFPQTKIALNHLGGPLGVGSYARQRSEAFAAWREALRRVSEFPNVYVKLGGLGMRLSGFGFHRLADPPSSEQLATAWQPYIETAIEAFGPQRSMFESNFPIDKGSCSYSILWNAFKRISRGYSADERSQLFSKTASSFYRLSE
jgi:L-fuconolactonase